jgi:hypothetical protein
MRSGIVYGAESIRYLTLGVVGLSVIITLVLLKPEGVRGLVGAAAALATFLRQWGSSAHRRLNSRRHRRAAGRKYGG